MKKIVLIEDNRDIRENITEILELAGYAVKAAENGKLGVALVLEESPDLILCDIMMPELDGHGVLHMLSKNEKTAGIPFIFLTAKAERSDFRKGMELGADDYLTKPFEDLELLHAIETRLRKNELLQKKFSPDKAGLDAFLKEAKSHNALEKLSDGQEILTFKKKDVIYREGSLPRAVYLVNKGKVKIWQSNDTGKELITGFYNEGEFFGYLPLLRDNIYANSAAALEDCEIYRIPKEDFFELIYKNPGVSRKFIELLSGNLQETESQLMHLAYDSVRKRVALALIQLSDKFKKTENHFTLNVTREEIANLAGTATETVIRTLSDFKEEKSIDIIGGKISIINYDKLAGIKN